MKLYKIRVTAEVLETAHETRCINVDSHVLTFGRQPAYIRAVKLPRSSPTIATCGSRP